MKFCIKCEIIKPLSCFNKTKNNKDGLQYWCKKCTSIYQHNNRHRRIEYNTRYYRTKKYKEGAAKRKAARIRSGCIKEKARILLRTAVRLGKITKPSICSQCSTDFAVNEIEGHHPDYNLPYLIIWVCRNCHKNLHFNQ